METLRRHRAAIRIAACAAGFAALTALTCLIARPEMLTGFAFYDDEGYMLTALQSFLDRGGLYDDVFTQYGPFYYEAWGTIFSLFGVPVTHDGGRGVTLVVWIATALTVGAATARMSGSIVLGLATQALVFGSLVTLTSEPMHPGGLVCLLLSAILAIACFVRERASVGAIAALGAAVAALALVKINVGIFALAAVALVCAVSYAPLADRRHVRAVVELGFVSLPLVLMAGELGQAWVREYAVHVSVAALAVVVVLRAREVPRRAPEELRRLVGGLVAVGLTSCLAIVGAGTSPSGLIDGLIGRPLQLSDAFSIPLELAGGIFLLDAIALVGAVAYLHLARRASAGGSIWTLAVPVASILIGFEMALSPLGETFPFDTTTIPGHQLGMLAFAWVALVPRPGGSPPAVEFARLLLPPLAVLQALHAFPVAGSQVHWSAFLLVPVGAICVGNGVRGLAQALANRPGRRVFATAATVGAVLTLAFVANVTLREELRDARTTYDALAPLDLPGARDVRVFPEEAEVYRAVASSIESNCRLFVTLPGLNSFYIWTGKDPPTGHNATAWTTLFSDELQREIIEEIDPIEDLCLLENEAIAAGWEVSGVADGPLVRYLRQGFEPVESIGGYELRRRRGSAA